MQCYTDDARRVSHMRGRGTLPRTDDDAGAQNVNSTTAKTNDDTARSLEIRIYRTIPSLVP